MHEKFTKYKQEHVTNVSKKIRHTTIILFLMVTMSFSFCIPTFLIPALKDGDFFRNSLNTISSIILILANMTVVYHILLYADVPLNIPDMKESNLYCTTENYYILKNVMLSIVLFINIYGFYKSIELFEHQIQWYVTIAGNIFSILVILWGFYKLSQKKLCREFPKEWLPEDEPSRQEK